MKRIHFLILALVISTVALPSWARKPAVDPIMGISIDNEPIVKDPSLSQGFKFDSYQELKRSPQSVNQTKPPMALNETEKTIPLLLIAFMLFLPVFVWFGFLKNLKNPHETRLEKKKEEDLHDHFKKAS